MTTLGNDRYADELRANTAAMADIVREADPGLPVPTCPEWTLLQLVGHVGRATRWAATIINGRATAAVPFSAVEDREPPEEPQRRPAWLVESANLLADAVAEAGPEAAVWSWSDDQTARFWLRRMLHETVIHRADAAFTVGAPYSVAADLAADGISEWLGILQLPHIARNERFSELLDDRRSLHFHATDPELAGGGEWLVMRTRAGVVVEAGHAKADVAVRGRAGDLFLLIMRRLPSDDPRFEVHGDADALDSWLAKTSF
jgi:uncharacterized protein (TIGR03083 family)